MTTLIQGENICKRYGSQLALDGLTFKIEAGHIIGLLGVNGAGKTSLLKVLLGLSSCQGDLSVLGLDPRKDRTALLERMCFIADVAILPKWLRVSEALDFVEGVHPKFNREKALMFLERTHIPLDAKVKALSKGMIAQLHLSLVMAIDVEILILDEPTLGLDILFRKTFYRSLIEDYFTEQRTIIIATHQMEEVEGLLTDVMILHQGKLLMQSPLESLLSQYSTVIAGPHQHDQLQALGPLSERSLLGETQFVFKDRPPEVLKQLGRCVNPTLSDIFLAILSQAGARS